MAKWYTASVAREKLSDLLDAAEAGEAVGIERRGVRYTVTKAAPRKRSLARRRLVLSADPAVAEGHWSWTWAEDGLSFAGRRTR